jgi:hypothetical protein
MADMVHGRADHLDLGDWNAACSICGRKRKASFLVKNWMGQWRCPEHNEPRQPQDFVRGVQDIQTPSWVQLERDVDHQVCTFNGSSAIPGYAIPGCMTPGRFNILQTEFAPPIPPTLPVDHGFIFDQSQFDIGEF